MRRRAFLVAAAMVAWVVGATIGTSAGGEGGQLTARAAPLLKFGKLEAAFTPSIESKKPIFILAIGSDARTDDGTPVEKGLGDSIHIIGVNTKKQRASIIGFPRDSWVTIPGHGSGKINEALFYGGPELMAQTVTDITGIRLDYYVLTSFEGVKNAVDDLGGLVVDVPFTMRDPYSKSDFKPGVQRLKGYDVLAFSRDRHSFAEGDFARSENQGRVLIAALAQFAKEFSKDPSRLLDWVGAGEQNALTDLSLSEALAFASTATSFDASKVQNVVATGRIGSQGAASVVFLEASNRATYDDMAKDAIISNKNVPPSPTAGEK